MRLSDFKLDITKLDGGVWWDFATKSNCRPNEPSKSGCFLLVPMVGNDAFSNEVDAETARHAMTLRDDKVDESAKRTIRKGIWARAFARHVLRGWSGFVDLPEYSEDRAVEFLTAREWAAVAEFLVMAASNREAAFAREEEQAKGN